MLKSQQKGFAMKKIFVFLFVVLICFVTFGLLFKPRKKIEAGLLDAIRKIGMV